MAPEPDLGRSLGRARRLVGDRGGAIIYLAGLQNISARLYEAALLDGAGPLQRFRYVTLPMITPTLLFVLLTGLIDAFQVFDLAYVLSRGGQGSGIAQLLPDQPVERGFVNGRYGYASALAWVLILIAGDDPARLPDLGPVGVLRVRPGSGAVSRVKTTIEAPARRVNQQATSLPSVAVPAAARLLHARDVPAAARPLRVHPAASRGCSRRP